MAVVTKLDRVVTYNKELLFITSEEPLITWPSMVTRQTKYVMPPLP